MDVWHDFFVAQVGATAALVGLLFVALSINVTPIIKHAWLPLRGMQTLVVLTGAFLDASIQLFPAASSPRVGFVANATSILTCATSIALIVLYSRAITQKSDGAIGSPRWLLYVATALLATVPPVVGTLAVSAGNDAGYYWVAGGILFGLVFALYNSWVLLVEILR